jgi:hypothetical protein
MVSEPKDTMPDMKSKVGLRLRVGSCVRYIGDVHYVSMGFGLRDGAGTNEPN